MFDISHAFDKIGTTFAVNAALELFGAVMTLVAIVTALSMHMEKKLLRLVIPAFAATFLTETGAAIAAIFRGGVGMGARWAVILGNFFNMAGIILCGVFYTSVLFYTFKKVDDKPRRIIRAIVCALSVWIFMVLVVSQFTGWLYVIDADNIYKRGPLFFLMGVYTVLIILCNLVYLLVWRKLQSKPSLHFALFIIIPTVGMVLQFVFYGFVFVEISLLLLMVHVLFRLERFSYERTIQQKELLSQKEVELAKTRDKLLLSQVRPHFIYNALAAIRHIKGNPPETKNAITDFANYLRGNLDALSSDQLISIEKELEHVKAYVELEKLRFDEKVSVSYDVRDTSFMLPPLSVQMLVENAIKHGITAQPDGGHIWVATLYENGVHTVQVRDDGVGFDTLTEVDEAHVGLRSVKNRLAVFVGGEMRVESAVGQGTTVTLLIPDPDQDKEDSV